MTRPASPATPIPPEIREASAAIRDGRLDHGIALLDAALARDPGSAPAHSARGMALLAQGRFVEGFAEYEWRHRVRGFEGDKPGLPAWDGRPAEGETLLVWDEQGLGDTIQFVRFAGAAARASRSRVVACVTPRLCRLLRSGATGWEVRSRALGFPPAHQQVSLMSLPAVLRLGTGELGAGPYLAAESGLISRWREHLAYLGRRPRVGLAWQGNPRHPDDARRSIPLAALGPLVRHWAEHISFVSLQNGPARDAVAQSGLPITDLGPELDAGPDAFVDTAAVVTGLDLVITSDTAIAHLAGALGVPVWVLLAQPCDWRWRLAGESTPFYASVQLFRQTTPGDWTEAIAAATAKLEWVTQPRGMAA